MTDPQPTDASEMDNDDTDRGYSPPKHDDNIIDDEPAAGGRPRLIVLIGSALLLLAIGAGLATAFAPSPVASTSPTAANPSSAGAELPTPAVPTALPLAQAIGDANSTDPLAQVGDVTITRGEFVRAYQPGDPAMEVLKQLIQVELVAQEAVAAGVSIDESQIDEQIAQIKLQNAIEDEAGFAAFLEQNDIASEQELRDLIGRSQLVDAMLLAHTTMEQAHARHILLSATDDQVEARKTEAEALLKQLQDGADFAALAGEKSEDPGSASQGGDLGWAPQGVFVTEFDEAVFSMEPGELRLVQTQFGWHIIQLIDAPELRSLDSRDMLSTAAGQQAFNDTFLPWLDQLQKDAEASQRVKILVSDDQLVTQPE